MKNYEQLGELATALSLAQSEMKGAVKDATNPFFKSRYADLESVWSACRESLAKNGLSVTQTMGFIPEAGPTLITTLLHSSGQWLSGEQPIMAKGLTPQELGSAITYARRYGLAAIVGIVQVDDDGEGAHQRHPGSHQTAPQEQNGGRAPHTGPEVSEAMMKRLYAIRMKSGLSERDVDVIATSLGIAKGPMTRKQYDSLISEIEKKSSQSKI